MRSDLGFVPAIFSLENTLSTLQRYDVPALPVIDGLEATRRIRALPGAAAQTPIIGISGRTEGGEAAARAAGMNAFFVKPVSPGKLAEALSRLA